MTPRLEKSYTEAQVGTTERCIALIVYNTGYFQKHLNINKPASAIKTYQPNPRFSLLRPLWVKKLVAIKHFSAKGP